MSTLPGEPLINSLDVTPVALLLAVARKRASLPARDISLPCTSSLASAVLVRPVRQAGVQ